jgi:hypothetical protein
VWGAIDRLEEGRIKNTRLIMDTLGLMVQLGVVPSTGGVNVRQCWIGQRLQAPNWLQMVLLNRHPVPSWNCTHTTQLLCCHQRAA